MLMPMGGRHRSRRLVGAAVGVLAGCATFAGGAAAAPGTCSGPGARAFDCGGQELRLQSAAERRADLAARRAALKVAGRRALPLAGGMYLADAKRPLQFDAPDGYLFTVRGSAAALMRRAGARAVYPEIGVWHVDASRGPALRDRLLARGLLHDAGLDTRRQLRAIPGSGPAVTEWWKDNVDAEGIDLPPPRKRLLIIDAGLDVAHPEFAGRPATVLENKQDVRFAPKKSGRDHGTRVASIAAAPVNGQGISGVFPTVGLGMWDAGGDEGFPIAQELRRSGAA